MPASKSKNQNLLAADWKKPKTKYNPVRRQIDGK